MTLREERAARWPTTVTLNLYQLSAVLAAVSEEADSGRGRGRRAPRDPDLRTALRKLGQAHERRCKAVERARGRK